MFPNVALNKEGGTGRINSDRQKELGQLQRSGSELSGVLGDRESVEIDHAEDGVGLVLIGDPMAQRSEKVAELNRTGGLNAREDTSHERRC